MSKFAGPKMQLFPVRPEPAKEENLIGYAIRLMTAIGVPICLSSEMELFGTKLAELPFNEVLVGRFAAACGIHGAWVKSKAIPIVDGNGAQRLQYQNLSISEHLLSLKKVKFCAKCLRQGEAHYRFLWDFRLMQRCPGHGCRLTGKCWNCAREFNWLSWSKFLANEFHCFCGACVLDFAVSKSEDANSNIGKKAQKEAARFFAGLVAPDIYPQWSRSICPELRDVPPGDLVELIQFFGALSELSRAPSRGRFSPTSSDYVDLRLTLGVMVLLDWPASFYTVIATLFAKKGGQKRGAPASVVRTLMSEKRLSSLGAAEGIVEDEIRKFTCLFSSTKVSIPVRGEYVRPKGMISSKEALLVLELGNDSLQCLLSRCEREEVRHLQTGGQWWFCEQGIQDVAQKYRLLIGRDELQSILGFDERDMKALKYSRHLPLLPRPFDGRRMLTAEMMSLNKMLGKVRVIESSGSKDASFLHGVNALRIFRSVPPKSKYSPRLTAADLVDAIADDALVAFRFSREGSIGPQLYFDESQLGAVGCRILVQKEQLFAESWRRQNAQHSISGQRRSTGPAENFTRSL
ncbi:MAG: TniQ family protein [Pseudomonadota bacterium]